MEADVETAKQEALLVRGSLEATEEVSSLLLQKRTESFSELMTLKEQLEMTEATAKKYEDKNETLEKELAEFKNGEDRIDPAEKEILNTLSLAREGYHEEVAIKMRTYLDERVKLQL